MKEPEREKRVASPLDRRSKASRGAAAAFHVGDVEEDDDDDDDDDE